MLIFGVVAMEPMPLKASLPPLIVVGPVKVLAPESVQVPVPVLVREVMLTNPKLVMTSPCKTLAAALKVTPLVVRDVGLLMETMVVFAGMLALLITLPTTKPSTEASNRVVLVVLTANLTMLPNTNALLSNLTLSTGGLTPSPFAAGTLTYAATNAYVSNLVTVTATSADANATLQLKLNGGSYTSLTSSVASGLQTLVLNPPVNTLVVKVTAQDGVTTNLYSVSVLLQPSVTAFTLTNGVSGGTNLVLSWPLDHTGYRLLTQTNNLNKGISANLADWGTVANYAATNAAVIPILTTNLNQYFRLVYP